MSIQSDIKYISSQIPVINTERNYWLVRTYGGAYFDECYDKKVIGIGYPEYPYKELLETYNEPNGCDKIDEYIRKRYKAEGNPGYIISQLTRFLFDIKKGDAVIIPATSSNFLAFGIVQDDSILDYRTVGFTKTEDLDKFRRVEWKRTLTKGSIEAELYKMLFSHHPVSLVNDYAGFIDRIFYPIYQKKGVYHINVRVATDQQISSRALFKTWSDLFDLVDEFSAEENLEFNSDDIRAKVKVQSEGTIEFISQYYPVLIILGFILIMIVGGGLRFEMKKEQIEANLTTDGLLDKLTKFLNACNERKNRDKVIEKGLKELNIKTPDQLVKIMNGLKSNEISKID